MWFYMCIVLVLYASLSFVHAETRINNWQVPFRDMNDVQRVDLTTIYDIHPSSDSFLGGPVERTDTDVLRRLVVNGQFSDEQHPIHPTPCIGISYAVSINLRRTIVGSCVHLQLGRWVGYLRTLHTPPQYEVIDPPNSDFAQALGHNSLGSQEWVVGFFRDVTVGFRGFRWHRSSQTFTIIDEPGIPPGGTAVTAINTQGWMTVRGGSGAGYVVQGNQWTPITIPGATDVFPDDINDTGVVVGTYGDSTGGRHAFVLEQGQVSHIDVPPELGSFTQVNHIANNGRMAGHYLTFDANGELSSHAYFTSPDGLTRTPIAPPPLAIQMRLQRQASPPTSPLGQLCTAAPLLISKLVAACALMSK